MTLLLLVDQSISALLEPMLDSKKLRPPSGPNLKNFSIHTGLQDTQLSTHVVFQLQLMSQYRISEIPHSTMLVAKTQHKLHPVNAWVLDKHGQQPPLAI
jgi:hypothetical protein